jgi:hypothetical protein
MEGTLAELLKIPGGRAALTSIAGDKAESESYTHILQIQERLMVELKSFGRKLEASSVRPSPPFSLGLQTDDEGVGSLRRNSRDSRFSQF